MGRATASLQRMSRYFLPCCFLLAAIWGSSFMFIKIADRELQPTTMMAGRLVLAATILFVLLASREASRPAVSRLRGAGLRRRARDRRSRAALHADRLGREAHRLGRGRDRERVDADLRRADRDPVPARRAGHRPAARRDRGSAWSASGVLVGVHPQGGWPAVSGRSPWSSRRSPTRPRASTASTSSRTIRRSC